MASLDLYSNIHHVSDLSKASVDDLQQIIQSFPIIDNHAHNLLTEENAYGSSDYPFECITSEAQGHALSDHVHSSLAHIRGIRHLAEFYQCNPTLQDVKAARYEQVRRDYPELIRKCFQGTHAIMMDDGLKPEIIHPFQWHREFVPTVKRIVRIEAIAAELLEQLAHAVGFLKVGMDVDWDIEKTETFLFRFNTVFRNMIRTLANDTDVRGFKSVICYRSGLDVGFTTHNAFRPHQSLTGSPLLEAFHGFLQRAVRDSNYRIAQKEVNDYLVVAVCDVLSKLAETDGESLPFQFHTGLGDTDINLIKANPAYMQPLVETFPNVDFVILHSSWPYTREASYLAANYVNAWLDIGEVFPMLSRDGEESILRQALELTPSSKILWSTDGHFYPETYWLSNKHFRAALQKLLVEYVNAGDLTPGQAINTAVDIMFWNSNALYKLDEAHHHPQLLKACGRSTGESLRTLVNGNSQRSSIVSHATTVTPASAMVTASDISNQVSPSQMPSPTSPLAHRPSYSLASISDFSNTAMAQNLVAFDAFLATNSNVKYIWFQFCDYTGTLRNRMVTIQQFRKHLTSGKFPAITTCLTRMMPDDHPAAGASATGEFLMAPDLSTLSLNQVIPSPSATVQTWWMTGSDESSAMNHWDRCPRWALQRQVNALKSEFKVDILMGFEIEIVFMRPEMTADGSDFAEFHPLCMVHSWSNMTHMQIDALPVVEEIVETLAEIDIHLPQFHAEAAPGQWEFPLPAFEPVKAVDVLLKAKDVIRNVAKKYGLKATMYPRPYDFTCGSACHAHFSLNGRGDTAQRCRDSFLAGILEHLPSILAFSLPVEESYERIGAGIWGGGQYVCWGTQNREAPIRACGPTHWELKTQDGMGNPYLSMAALLAAGLYGLRWKAELTMEDCLGDPTGIGEEGRRKLGITTMLPGSLDKSLKALAEDEILREMLGEGLIEDYLAISEAMMQKLNDFGEKKRRIWLMSRY